MFRDDDCPYHLKPSSMVTVEVDSFFITHPELVGISSTRNMGTKDEGNSRVATYGQEAQWLGGSYSQLGNLQGGVQALSCHFFGRFFWFTTLTCLTCSASFCCCPLSDYHLCCELLADMSWSLVQLHEISHSTLLLCDPQEAPSKFLQTCYPLVI